MINVTPIFCSYFKKIEKFRFSRETYSEYTAFCVKSGSFSYQINEEKQQIVSGGEIIICPPGQKFSRKIITPIEMCMIKFTAPSPLPVSSESIKIINIIRYYDNLKKLENCIFCDALENYPEYQHYCMDVLLLFADSLQFGSQIEYAKKKLDEGFNKNVSISEVAKDVGYTTPHFINVFKNIYGITPKAYLNQIKILKAKELLLSTQLFSKEIAYSLGFEDDLYFIRFFKQRTGLTPKQFREKFEKHLF